MARWENFSIWRGRLPHWRADHVTYYVTFRHRRALEAPFEVATLLDNLRKLDGRKWRIVVACVLPEVTEMLLELLPNVDGSFEELSDVVEKAKNRASKAIIKQTGERFGPFYHESYDRIIRDDAEREERFEAILRSPVDLELCESPEDYEGLWAPANS